jgi:hypothetical protein
MPGKFSPLLSFPQKPSLASAIESDVIPARNWYYPFQPACVPPACPRDAGRRTGRRYIHLACIASNEIGKKAMKWRDWLKIHFLK